MTTFGSSGNGGGPFGSNGLAGLFQHDLFNQAMAQQQQYQNMLQARNYPLDALAGVPIFEPWERIDNNQLLLLIDEEEKQ